MEAFLSGIFDLESGDRRPNKNIVFLRSKSQRDDLRLAWYGSAR
jgi:hypothetical protein